MLQSPDVPVEAKLFAATTLKGKVKRSHNLHDAVLAPRTDRPRSSSTLTSYPRNRYSPSETPY